MSAFSEGLKVVCISEDFPLICSTNKEYQIDNKHPIKGEVLIIDEILGDFLMFEKYNTQSINWWHNTRFALVYEMDGHIEIYGKHLPFDSDRCIEWALFCQNNKHNHNEPILVHPNTLHQ